jgi:organic radical activating enzyme
MQIDEIRYENNNHIYVDIVLGNTCNFKCSYCPDSLHNGSDPWLNINALKKFSSKLIDFYSSVHDKNIFMFNLLGGEPTLYKDIVPFCQQLKELEEQKNCLIQIEFLTNGFRKLKWWEENIELFDKVKISHHPEFAKPEHSRDVADIVTEHNKYAAVQMLMNPEYWDKCMDHANIILDSKYDFTVVKKLVLKDFWTEPYDYTPEQLKIFDGPFRGSIAEIENKKIFNRRPIYYFENEKIGRVRPPKIIAEGLNKFKGWTCYAGIDILSVDFQGKIKLGGACKMEYDGITNKTIYDDYDFPNSPQVCAIDICACSPDVETRKFKNR